MDYLPRSLLDQTGLERGALVDDWCMGVPVVHSVVQTTVGRFATIILPVFDDQLYAPQTD